MNPHAALRQNTRKAIWLVVAVFLLQALQPLLGAGAWAAGDKLDVIEICSTHGTQYVVVDAEGKAVDKAAAAAFCPCCVAGTCGTAGFPGATGNVPVPGSDPRATRVARIVHDHRPVDPQRAWLSRKADGPPASR